MKQPKYIELLRYLSDKHGKSIHYTELINVVYDEETIKKYKNHKDKRCIIDSMICMYLGKLERKDYIHAEYKNIKKYTYLVGYYIGAKGIEILKNISK